VLRFPGRYVGILQLVPHEQALETCLPGLSLSAQPATRYNTFTQQLEQDPVAALNQFRHSYKYTFQPNGQYLYEIELDNFSRYRRVDTVLSPSPVPAPYTRRFIRGPIRSMAMTVSISRTPTAPGTRFPLPASDHRPRGVR
jgi:hypothetical protein